MEINEIYIFSLKYFKYTQSNRVFKTSKYEYSSSAQNSYNDRKGNLNEINKLDTLLSDLEKERTSTLDRSECEKKYVMSHTCTSSFNFFSYVVALNHI